MLFANRFLPETTGAARISQPLAAKALGQSSFCNFVLARSAEKPYDLEALWMQDLERSAGSRPGQRMLHFEFGQHRLAQPHPLQAFELA
jgi:hypothetical protein